MVTDNPTIQATSYLAISQARMHNGAWEQNTFLFNYWLLAILVVEVSKAASLFVATMPYLLKYCSKLTDKKFPCA